MSVIRTLMTFILNCCATCLMFLPWAGKKSNSRSPSKNRQQQQQQIVVDDNYANYGSMNGSNMNNVQRNLNEIILSGQQQQQQNVVFESNFGSSFWSCPVCKLNFSSEQGMSMNTLTGFSNNLIFFVNRIFESFWGNENGSQASGWSANFPVGNAAAAK